MTTEWLGGHVFMHRDIDLRQVPFEIRRSSEAARKVIDEAKHPLTAKMVLDSIVVFDADGRVVCRMVRG